MKKSFRGLQKYRIRLKIFILFLIFVVIPYIVLIFATYKVFQDYAGDNFGSSMQETMISESNQVSSSLKTYEDSTMSLYHNGSIDQLESGNADRDFIEHSLAACCYSYSGIKAAYLSSGDEIYFSGTKVYKNLTDIMKKYSRDISEGGGKYMWFTSNELYGKASTRQYILARSLNGKEEKNIGILYYIISDQMIRRAFDRLQMEDNTKYMLDADGTVLYSSDKSAVNQIMQTEILDSKNKNGYQITDDGSGKNVEAYSRMEKTGWVFMGSASMASMMRSMQPLKQVVVVISIVYCLFLILVFYTFQRYFLKPISELKYAMDQFAKGNREVQMGEISSGELKSLSGHFNSMTKRINELILNNEKEVNEKNNFKMQALVAQLQPHFLYNALNTIKWMAVINKQENIRNLTEALIYILMNAAKSDKENYTLKEEIELIKRYAVIQKARFMNFEMDFNIEEQALSCRIFRFLIQPVVENAIIHGFKRGMTRGGKISVCAWVEGEILKIRVSDNGCGFDMTEWKNRGAVRENHTNIGLTNIEQIISLEYGGEYGMEITSEPERGTVVEYRLPAKGEESK